MRRVLRIIILLIAVIMVTSVTSGAYFADRETSVGNSMSAGSIDLQINNKSYYFGETGIWNSWELTDLTGELFFDYDDLAPGDWGEDTMGLQLFGNPAWICLDINLTSNDDISCNDPELGDDPACNDPDGDIFDGDLAQVVNFIFWVDDGDNVFEDNEQLLLEDNAYAFLNTKTIALADANGNVWRGAGPMMPGQIFYLGKAWCFGNLTKTPLPQGQGVSPDIDPGIDCDGWLVNNASQTDEFTGNVIFEAIQVRHNEGFVCE